MVQYQRYHQWRKGEDAPIFKEEDEKEFPNSPHYHKRKRPKILYLFLICLLSFIFALAPHLFGFSTLSLLYSFGVQSDIPVEPNFNAPLCSSMATGTICCDRSNYRSDVCVMKGDIRTHSPSSSIFLYTSTNLKKTERVRPYTRKWEAPTMDTVGELSLVAKNNGSGINHKCDVTYNVPALFFSTGGYTGNLFHEFNDGIIPIYISSRHFERKVVFVILEYWKWWIMKYGDIMSGLTGYPIVDFKKDKRTYCFSEAIVGLRIHGDFIVEPTLMKGNKSILDLRDVFDQAYGPRIRGLVRDEERKMRTKVKNPSLSPKLGISVRDRARVKKPRLVIMSRKGSRVILNQDKLVKLAEEIGFEVQILRPTRTSELAQTYRAMNETDAMMGVHGAALTHCLYLRPGSWFIQVIPLGIDWAAETYFDEPARKFGLNYIGYKIHPEESSLYEEYDRTDPVLVDPESVAKKGWESLKRVYLVTQNVKLDLGRFRKHLVRAYDDLVRRVED